MACGKCGAERAGALPASAPAWWGTKGARPAPERVSSGGPPGSARQLRGGQARGPAAARGEPRWRRGARAGLGPLPLRGRRGCARHSRSRRGEGLPPAERDGAAGGCLRQPVQSCSGCSGDCRRQERGEPGPAVWPARGAVGLRDPQSGRRRRGGSSGRGAAAPGQAPLELGARCRGEEFE